MDGGATARGDGGHDLDVVAGRQGSRADVGARREPQRQMDRHDVQHVGFVSRDTARAGRPDPSRTILVLGSKPEPALPPPGSYAALACANASGFSARAHGLPPPLVHRGLGRAGLRQCQRPPFAGGDGRAVGRAALLPAAAPARGSLAAPALPPAPLAPAGALGAPSAAPAWLRLRPDGAAPDPGL